MYVVPSASGTYPYELAPLTPGLKARFLTLSNADSERLDRRYGPPVPPSVQCDTCSLEGIFKTRLQNGEVVTCECNCREQWMLGRLLTAANIDKGHQRFSWNHVRDVPEDVEAMVIDYVFNLPRKLRNGLGLVLWSERRGTGKSLLTTLVLKSAIAHGYSAYYIRFVDLLDAHAAGWRDDEARDWFAKRIQNADFLAIDELGKESAQTTKAMGMVDELLDRVLRSRVANERPTLVTSNLDPDSDKIGEGFARYQQDVLELLSEGSKVIEVAGSGYRKKARDLREQDDRENVVYPVVVR